MTTDKALCEHDYPLSVCPICNAIGVRKPNCVKPSCKTCGDTKRILEGDGSPSFEVAIEVDCPDCAKPFVSKSVARRLAAQRGEPNPFDVEPEPGVTQCIEWLEHRPLDTDYVTLEDVSYRDAILAHLRSPRLELTAGEVEALGRATKSLLAWGRGYSYESALRISYEADAATLRNLAVRGKP